MNRILFWLLRKLGRCYRCWSKDAHIGAKVIKKNGTYHTRFAYVCLPCVLELYMEIEQ